MTIAQAAARYGLTPDTLRYYERVGLIPPVARTPGGVRNFDESACRWIEFAKCMRSAGVGVEPLAQYVALVRQGARTIPQRKAMLAQQRDQIQARVDELQAALERLNRKLDGYEERMLSCEEALTSSAPAAGPSSSLVAED